MQEDRQQPDLICIRVSLFLKFCLVFIGKRAATAHTDSWSYLLNFKISILLRFWKMNLKFMLTPHCSTILQVLSTLNYKLCIDILIYLLHFKI